MSFHGPQFRGLGRHLEPSLCVCLVLMIRSSVSLCILPSPSSISSHSNLSDTTPICFEENNTDPNILNHKLTFDNQNNVLDKFATKRLGQVHFNTSRDDIALSESRAKSGLTHENAHFGLPRRRYPKPVKRPYYYSPSTQTDADLPKGSVFIPVAAYSITKKKPKKPRKPVNSLLGRHRMAASSVSLRRKPTSAIYHGDDTEDGNENGEEDSEDDEPEDDYEMRKESAVYGYVHKPEIIEFRGQYYYGQNDNEQGNRYSPNSLRPQLAEYGEGHESMNPLAHERHRVSYMPIHETIHEHEHDESAAALLLSKLKKGITAKGLLLASLPLMLTPVISYLLTPVVIPITANVAAGRRRKRHTQPWTQPSNDTFQVDAVTLNNRVVPEHKLQEAKILLEYLNQVKPDERLTKSAVANFLECDGLFLPSDQCLEQLSCEFSDIQNANVAQLERAVTSIILAHLLHNEFISNKFKKRLKRAAVYGRSHSGQCKAKYPCQRVLLKPNLG